MIKWRCNACERIFEENDLLRAANPFDAEQTITGCPDCKSVEDFTEICDEPNCYHPATCGFPTLKGYRRTCGEHADFLKVKP